MSLLLAVAVGTVFGASLHLMLQGSLWRLLVGLALLGHGAHLLIFAASGPVFAAPPLVREGALRPDAGSADPLPQALILTAIVISFAVLAFALVLALRAGQAARTDELDAYGGERG